MAIFKISQYKFFLLITLFCICFSSCNSSNVEDISILDSSSRIEESSEKLNAVRDSINVGHTGFAGNFNPFYVVDSNDLQLMEMTSARLLTFDRNGNVVKDAIEGEKRSFNDEFYSYVGITNVKIIQEDNCQTTIELKLVHNAKFSDGEPLTVNDLIFTLYVLSDPTYDGPFDFSTLPIIGLNEYKNGAVNYIQGITKVDERTLKLSLSDFNESYFKSLNVFVAPLHYYGDPNKFNFEKCMFGFEKGNLEDIVNKNTVPLGAGPYFWASYDGEVVVLERNINYYKGLPKLKYVLFNKIDLSEMLTHLANGRIDICDIKLDDNLYQQFIDMNETENGFLYSAAIYYDENEEKNAVISNSKALNINVFDKKYNRFYSWIYDVNKFEINPVF